MDDTKKPLGIVAMVYQDYDLLQRWYDYYANQVGAENLFVFSHGNDPKHREIATGANVINVPRDPTMVKFDRRRWTMLSAFTSGMLQFYNWMLVTDIDEMVIVDPDVAPSLTTYLRNSFPKISDAPSSICPFALNIIHIPEEETLPIEPGQTILSRRRYFAPSRVYSKPTLVRQPVGFGPGGHRNNLGLRTLSDDLYLVHLKYFDMGEMISRAKKQASLVNKVNSKGAELQVDHVWSNTVETYHNIRENHQLGPENIALPEIRAAMMKQKQKYTDQYIWGAVNNSILYRIPERFAPLI